MHAAFARTWDLPWARDLQPAKCILQCICCAFSREAVDREYLHGSACYGRVAGVGLTVVLILAFCCGGAGPTAGPRRVACFCFAQMA
jgi:hypothetical protein